MGGWCSREDVPRRAWQWRCRGELAAVNAAWAVAGAAVTRDARGSVTSAMLVVAKPTPAVTAKTNVIAHTAHPASEVARCRACQSLAAQEGATSATRSAATPMARNSHPAASLDPSDRADPPVIARPTAAQLTRAGPN